MASEKQVRLVAVTKTVDPNIPAGTLEEFITYVARVSNPANQEMNKNPEKLISYCIRQGHWSVFEQAYVTVEVNTYSSIAMQILRHRSFCFQQFSQRYANVETCKSSLADIPEPRKQDPKNRQNTTDDVSDDVKKQWYDKCAEVNKLSSEVYNWGITNGIGKECARFVLPQMTKTRLYMTGNIRSFIHYIEARTNPGTQKEHRDVALEIRSILSELVPTVAKAMNWTQ